MKNINISTAGFGYMGRLHTVAYRGMPLCYENFNYNIILYKLLTSRRNTNNCDYIVTPNFKTSMDAMEIIEQGYKNSI